jgi:DNA-directed RNA polymerase specialized sigma24 family protein
MQRADVAELAPTYERFARVHAKRSLLSPEDLQLLVEESDVLPARLDVLCRFVLVMHGIAKESCEEVAAQLGVSQSAVERAYCAAFDTLHLIEKDALLRGPGLITSEQLCGEEKGEAQ